MEVYVKIVGMTAAQLEEGINLLQVNLQSISPEHRGDVEARLMLATLMRRTGRLDDDAPCFVAPPYHRRRTLRRCRCRARTLVRRPLRPPPLRFELPLKKRSEEI